MFFKKVNQTSKKKWRVVCLFKDGKKLINETKDEAETDEIIKEIFRQCKEGQTYAFSNKGVIISLPDAECIFKQSVK